jgi:hypothetical protein
MFESNVLLKNDAITNAVKLLIIKKENEFQSKFETLGIDILDQLNLDDLDLGDLNVSVEDWEEYLIVVDNIVRKRLVALLLLDIEANDKLIAADNKK